MSWRSGGPIDILPALKDGDSHPNPRGYCTEALPAGLTERDLSQDEVLYHLIAKAARPQQAGHGYRFR